MLLPYLLGDIATYRDVLVQLISHLLVSKYNTPPVFRLADYFTNTLDPVQLCALTPRVIQNPHICQSPSAAMPWTVSISTRDTSDFP